MDNKSVLIEYNNIIKLLLKEQCVALLTKFKCIYKLSYDDYKKEYDNIIKQINDLSIQLNFKKYVKATVPKKKNAIKSANRCSARVFNYNNIITQRSNKLIYGTRCTREKVKDSKYCKQHKIHMPHGDYYDDASAYIKTHYIKEYTLYVRKENPKHVIKLK